MGKELKYRRKRCKSKRQPKKSKRPSMDRKRCERCHGLKKEVKRFVPPKEPVKKQPKKIVMGPPPPPGPKPQPIHYIGSLKMKPLFHPTIFKISHPPGAWHYSIYSSATSQTIKKQ